MVDQNSKRLGVVPKAYVLEGFFVLFYKLVKDSISLKGEKK